MNCRGANSIIFCEKSGMLCHWSLKIICLNLFNQMELSNQLWTEAMRYSGESRGICDIVSIDLHQSCKGAVAGEGTNIYNAKWWRHRQHGLLWKQLPIIFADDLNECQSCQSQLSFRVLLFIHLIYKGEEIDAQRKGDLMRMILQISNTVSR